MKFCAHIEEAPGVVQISAQEGQVLDPPKKKKTTNELIECEARVCTSVGQLLFFF